MLPVGVELSGMRRIRRKAEYESEGIDSLRVLRYS